MSTLSTIFGFSPAAMLQAQAEQRAQAAQSGPPAQQSVTFSTARPIAPAAQTTPSQVSQRQKQATADAMTSVIVGGVVGGVVGGAAGAALWTNHRFLGFLLGSVFVGAPAGYGIGMAIGIQQVKKVV